MGWRKEVKPSRCSHLFHPVAVKMGLKQTHHRLYMSIHVKSDSKHLLESLYFSDKENGIFNLRIMVHMMIKMISFGTEMTRIYKSHLTENYIFFPVYLYPVDILYGNFKC